MINQRGPSGSLRRSNLWNELQWKELFQNNAMLEVAAREQLTFLKKSVGYGKPVGWISGIVFLLVYASLIFGSATQSSDQSMFYCYLGLILTTLLIPASIYNAISGERERATWDALVLTRLTSAQIITAKVTWRLRLVVLIFILGLPLLTVTHMTGGEYRVLTSQLCCGQLLIISWGIFLASFGIAVSSMTSRAIMSLAIIFGTLMILLIAVPILSAMFGIAGGVAANHDILADIMAFNPFVQLAITLGNRDFTDVRANVLTSGLVQSAVYFLASVALLLLTHRRLSSMQQPEYRSR